MKLFRRLLERGSAEDGMSLIEALVAMMVFAVISLGIIASLATITRLTADTRARQVASNLAVTDIDLSRTKDPFKILDDQYTVDVSGRTYTVTRSTSWVNTAGSDVGCGDGTGTLQSKRVNVEVIWGGMLATTTPVRSDTLVSPEGRINDPSLGTIRVSVLGANGSGAEGVTVAIATAGDGSKALAEQPAATNSEGCSYALKVYPGTYKVTISRAESVDTAQVTAPSKTVIVTKGGSVAAQFQYDYAAKFSLTYASNYTPAPKFPTNLDTSFISTYGTYVDSPRKTTPIGLHPFSSGYSGIAGKYVPKSQSSNGCLSVDPASWPEATVNKVALAAGERTPPVAADPGKSVGMNIPMGIVTVNQSGNYTLTAESATALSSAADPGCASPMSYTFGAVSGAQTIALPYGSWTLYATNGFGVKSAIPATNVGLLASVAGLLSGTGNIITLDPRVAK